MGQCLHPQVRSNKGTNSEPEVPAEDSFDDRFGFAKIFKHIRLLGEGGSGETWLMREMATEELVAVKLIARPIPRHLHKMLLQEIKIQGDLGEGHLNIVTFREVVLTPTHVALVMEYVPGGTLTKYVSDRCETTTSRNGLFLTEEEARFIFKQVLSAVEYIHRHNVAHRDLKLDNTLLDKNELPCIKICDFGFAKDFEPAANLYSQIGTPVYMSPELISSKSGSLGYDGQKADVWALGVVLFVMLLGMFPYEHSAHPDPYTSGAQIEVWLQQIRGNWKENGRVREAAKRLSKECQDLLDHIFDLDESRRMSIDKVKSHPWVSIAMSDKYETAWQIRQAYQQEIKETIKKYGPNNDSEKYHELEGLISNCVYIGQTNEEIKRISMTRNYKSYKFNPKFNIRVED